MQKARQDRRLRGRRSAPRSPGSIARSRDGDAAQRPGAARHRAAAAGRRHRPRGDGRGPARHRLVRAAPGHRASRSRRIWSAAPPTTRTARRCTDATLAKALGGGRGAVRRGRRPAIRRPAVRAEARARPAAPAQGARTCSPTCARPWCSTPLADASSLKPELVRGPRHHDPARADRRRLFRRAARHRDPARRRSAAASTPRSTPRAEIERVARVGFELARKRRSKVMLGREGQRHGIRRALARGGADAARRRVSRRRARPHVRRQLRHAAGAPAQAVRRDRHRQPVRRHPLRLRGDADRLARHAALGLARRARRADGRRKALYEPVHGSAPDIAGQGIANPIAMPAELRDDAALLVRPGRGGRPAGRRDRARCSRAACAPPTSCRTGKAKVSTSAMGEAIVRELDKAAA